MDYVYFLTQYENVSTSYNFLAATDWTTAVAKIAAKAGQSLFIQKITLSVTTDHAAVQTLQTSNATPVEVAKSKASPGNGPITWDFGVVGYEVPAGEGLFHKMSAAGMAGTVAIQAYRRKTPNM